ncbi:hypothetical protein ACIKT0_00025 [Hansschlegelia beijingensis]|uniref:hypothetical protein n=1 Tax=Hansschlegelia beijingensis TaxID=1133344 RepID=UPI00387F2AB4
MRSEMKMTGTEQVSQFGKYDLAAHKEVQILGLEFIEVVGEFGKLTGRAQEDVGTAAFKAAFGVEPVGAGLDKLSDDETRAVAERAKIGVATIKAVLTTLASHTRGRK